MQEQRETEKEELGLAVVSNEMSLAGVGPKKEEDRGRRRERASLSWLAPSTSFPHVRSVLSHSSRDWRKHVFLALYRGSSLTFLEGGKVLEEREREFLFKPPRPERRRVPCSA